MANQSSPHIFLGYLCYNPNTGKILNSHDVVFVENDFSESQKLKNSDPDDEDSTRLQSESVNNQSVSYDRVCSVGGQ